MTDRLDPIPSRHSKEGKSGFTLVELLVSIVVLIAIVGILFSMIQQTSNLWKNTSGKIEGLKNARTAFDAMTRTISQATLNNYLDYVDASGNWVTATNPQPPAVNYKRRSDLHFICGQASKLLTGASTQAPVTHCIFFQAPLGRSSLYPEQPRLLNACGFYVIYGPDPNVPTYLSALLPARYRYRLMQFLQPSESLAVYNTSSGNAWFTTSVMPTLDLTSNYIVAENVVALLIWPQLSQGEQAAVVALGTNPDLTSDYGYDTRQTGSTNTNQLPPVVEVTMVAIDEASALRMGNPATAPNATVGLTQAGLPLFVSSTSTPNQLQADLAKMESTLTASHVNFRVFQTEVAIGGAKWTSP